MSILPPTTPSAQPPAPKRIQRKRTKGWRMPEGAVYVGRPTKWGNPYTLKRLSAHEYVVLGIDGAEILDSWGGRNFAAKFARDAYRTNVWWPGQAAELSGRDLACWCPLDQPCHADVLLDIANNCRDCGGDLDSTHHHIECVAPLDQIEGGA